MAPNGEHLVAVRHPVQKLQRRGNIFSGVRISRRIRDVITATQIQTSSSLYGLVVPVRMTLKSKMTGNSSHPSASVVDVERTPDIIPSPQPIVTNAASVFATEMAALPGQDLPVKQFMKQCDLVIANNRENWNEDTTKDVRIIVRIFCGIMGEHNVLTSSAIHQAYLAA
ncbi:hypothetical protein GJU94_07170 [Brucella sp. 10RB9214]|uniref:hypothetical protein n=1 Tax=unclassified Brucella TaxID=2632610 RepID=UPI0009727AFF|nr:MULTISPECIES: hypothetical protein [unclassified Brucella]APY13353.1 hypothetical protein BKD02_02680 [Brucella sp. 09RB8910]MRN46326.1 hypothetical protein [Brucella sp. 10RB9212]MRN49615.1 hypothetical protein [Brucella sp. 10RB9214]